MARVRVESYRTKKNEERWRVWFKDPADGRWVKRVLHNCGSREEAQAAAAAIETDLFRQRWFPEEAGREQETVRLACKRRAALAKGRSSEAQDLGRLRTIEAFFGPDRPLSTITVRDVASFREHVQKLKNRRGELLAPATVRHHQVLLRHVFALAAKDGRLTNDPARAVPLVRVQNQRERLVTKAELRILLKRLPPWLRTLTIVAYETGMRLGEIVALRQEDLHLDGPEPFARVRKSKIGRPRSVPLTPDAVAALRGGLPETTSASVSPAWARWMRKLGIEDLRFHDLRHAFASRHWLTHRDSLRLMAEGGWATPMQLARYVNLTSADLERARTLLVLPLGARLLGDL